MGNRQSSVQVATRTTEAAERQFGIFVSDTKSRTGRDFPPVRHPPCQRNSRPRFVLGRR